MSHGKLREEKDCLNCGHTVEEKYCPNCGQQNTPTRQPFYYLFTHFIEDFTHYDGQFWRTIKNLLFKPGKLTSVYLEGKRQQYVPPVKLYIFISFITFFLFAVFPPFNLDFIAKNDLKNATEQNLSIKGKLDETKKIFDSLKTQSHISVEDSAMIAKLAPVVSDSSIVDDLYSDLDMSNSLEDDFEVSGYKNRKSFDSATAKNPRFFDFINTAFAHKLYDLKERKVKKGEIIKSLSENAAHHLPKALFIYLPIFAFFLWIFHNKKKWWYFEHGVFTLHYFSFLLLSILLFFALKKVTDVNNISIINSIIYFLMVVLVMYNVLYFFIAHHRVYRSHGMISLIIGFILLNINFIAFSFVAIGLGVISFLLIH